MTKKKSLGSQKEMSDEVEAREEALYRLLVALREPGVVVVAVLESDQLFLAGVDRRVEERAHHPRRDQFVLLAGEEENRQAELRNEGGRVPLVPRQPFEATQQREDDVDHIRNRRERILQNHRLNLLTGMSVREKGVQWRNINTEVGPIG